MNPTSEYLFGGLLRKITIGENYLTRYFIVPRNKFLNIYLHKYTGSDDDRALHDHPWWSISFNIAGRLGEVRELVVQNDYGWAETREVERSIVPWFPILRAPEQMHRMTLRTPTAWTIFITGPYLRDWGFRQHDEEGGWLYWETFIEKFGLR